MTSDKRLSVLIQLDDRPGALEGALGVFRQHGVNLTHIESRPTRGDTFDFYVDCEGERGEANIEATITALSESSTRMFILDDKEVPWFPRHIAELDRIATETLDAGDALESDHPGFQDAEYRRRRAEIDQLARDHRWGDDIPVIDYTSRETDAWQEIFETLKPLHARYACPQFLRAFADLERECGYAPRAIPQGRDVDAFLRARTGFRIWPVAGLLSARNF
ncbi:MAG: ACT domain-containing protein [Gammaproteobacteria bacterium]|nr:ACT domain-containing protein [Gammaproteobacteria bacterium]